uniref:Regulator of telomere elongation helicase 1 n=1 Tax=Oreochromis niloticus TaxID=8128 RepID=A0A669AZU7_ORENI
MPSLTLSGVTVNFPFSPYECQKAYMNKVIECLQKKVNGVLESPTGTGKTLCLLCATLAWRENFKGTISARKIAERLGKEMFPNTPLSSWGTAATDAYYTDVPKIVYASRTHSQLAQVISELKNTSYRPKVCVLGSREQLCINQEVMRQESNHVKVHMCRGKVSTRSCVYYNNVEEKSTDRDLVNSILDVEDLVQFGTKQRVCPYYLSRSLKQQADVIFMPYNYLLDPKSRKAHNIDLNGAVVIFDEAHNVEKTCEESTSFDLTPYDVASAINAVDRLLVEQAKEISHKDSVNEDVNVLERAHLTYSNKTAVYEALEQISGYLAGQPGIFLNTSGLQKLSDIIQVHFVWILKKQVNVKLLLCLGFCIGNILSYWCFSPGFSMQDLVNQGVRCIILTSGTLSPLSSFTSEMRIEFPVRLENSHVIERDQIFVSIIAQGPDGAHLSSAFDRRFVPENMASLGNTVANLSRVVPHGLLVFFPSFPLMEKTLEFWKVSGKSAESPVEKNNILGVEGGVIDGYYSKVNDPASKGGSFFAVCRGKASEGLDFADTYGRGVIITGLPFPPKNDPRVILKMQFLDEMNRKKAPGLKYLSGQDWYKQQAFRAVNQAIGRVIRHKEDYGAIFLCDQRFKSADARAQLPSWVRSYVRLCDSFGNVVRDVSQFFRIAQKMVSCRTCTVHTMQQILALFSFVKEPAHNFPLVLLLKANHLSTLSLQYDKRMEDELRGGKRKIKLVQEQVSGKASRAKKFLADMKKSLSQVSFDRIIQALQTYKKTDDLDQLLTETAILSEDTNTQSLLHGFYQFVRPHHKKRFDENCQELTGKGCGYKPDHTLSKDEKKTVFTEHTVGWGHLHDVLWMVVVSSWTVVLTLTSPRPPSFRLALLHTYPYKKLVPCNVCQWCLTIKLFHTTFLTDVKKALGAERSTQLFQAIHTYKKTDNYEKLVTTAVSLFTERDENFGLLVRFGMFIRPNHKKQYKDMLDGLIGQPVSAPDVPVMIEEQQEQPEGKSLSQSKISSFFSSSQRR